LKQALVTEGKFDRVKLSSLFDAVIIETGGFNVFSNSETPVTAFQNEEDIVVLQPNEIYMVRVEDGDTIIYGEKKKYRSRKRLYELANQLGKQFMQISKTTLINLSYMDCIEPGFSGTLLLKLKNGSKDYVSRKYLPEFKKYLGL
jgi:DNA-binding LytR/AlgR family response regulator